jgi:hypothetical protein
LRDAAACNVAEMPEVCVASAREANRDKERRKVKADIFIEIFLWDKNVDSVVRVLQRMEGLGVWYRPEMTRYEAQLEELRSAVNADFAKKILKREQTDRWRRREESRAWQSSNNEEHREKATQ